MLLSFTANSASHHHSSTLPARLQLSVYSTHICRLVVRSGRKYGFTYGGNFFFVNYFYFKWTNFLIIFLQFVVKSSWNTSNDDLVYQSMKTLKNIFKFIYHFSCHFSLCCCLVNCSCTLYLWIGNNLDCFREGVQLCVINDLTIVAFYLIKMTNCANSGLYLLNCSLTVLQQVVLCQNLNHFLQFWWH